MIAGRKKDIVMLVTSMVFSRALGLAFFIISARLLFPHDFGILRTNIAIAAVFGIGAFTGFPQSLTRFIADAKHSCDANNREIRHSIIYSSSLYGTIMILSVSLLILFLLNLLDISILILIIGETTYYFYLGLVRGNMNFLLFSMANFSTGACKFLFILPLYLFSIDITPLSLSVVYGISYIAPIILLELFIPSRYRLVVSISVVSTLKEMTVFGAPIIVANLAYTLLFSGDIVIVELFSGSQEAGYYGVSKTICQVFLFLPIAINIILMPEIARAAPKHLNELLRIITKPLLFVGLISMLGFIFLYQFQFEVLSIFGYAYEDAMFSLMILALATIIYSIYIIFEAVFIGTGRPRIHMYSLSIGAITFLIISFLFFRNPGQFEIATSLLITFSLVLIISICFIILIFGRLSGMHSVSK